MEAMTEDQTYQGWKNYPTWAVNLWLSNDEGTYNTVREMAAAAETQARVQDEPEAARFALADSVEEMVREMVEMDEASVRSDLLGFALDQVDWREVADTWLED